jgi:hypothetical protein
MYIISVSILYSCCSMLWVRRKLGQTDSSRQPGHLDAPHGLCGTDQGYRSVYHEALLLFSSSELSLASVGLAFNS